MQNFCYKCGKIPKEKNKLLDNLCQECYTELHPLLKIPHPLQLKLCKKCNRFYLKDRWISSHFTELEDLLEYATKEVIPLKLEFPSKAELVITTNIIGNLESILRTSLILIDIQIVGTSHEAIPPYSEKYVSQDVKLTFTICPSCLSIKRGEYQAVLHVIAPNRELAEQERDYILSLIETESEKLVKTDYLAYISKFKSSKGKISFYIGSEKFARSLASTIGYNLGGTPKETYKSGSHRIPKEVKQNKLYISLYLPSFVRGDLLLVKNAPLYVTKILSKKVRCINLDTYETVKLPLKLLKNAEILQHSNSLRLFLYFSQTKETIQLMDLQNYQIYEISNFPKYSEFEIGNHIKGFEVKGQIFLIPKSK